MATTRTPARAKARLLARYLRDERPDYAYLKQVFRHLREEMDIPIPKQPRRLPAVPTEEEVQRLYQTIWQARNFQDMVLIKTFLYTGVRVSELVRIRLIDVDLERCQIRIHQGKGGKDRQVPFPVSFREVLAMHLDRMRDAGAQHLFESSWKRRYSDRGIRKLLERYVRAAELERTISPHQLRHFLLTWLKKQGIDDALIQPYSGHESRQSLEVYSRLALEDAQQAYEQVIKQFPV